MRSWHLGLRFFMLNTLQIRKNPEPIEIPGFQKEKVFGKILQYCKSNGSKVYCGINGYFSIFCYIENAHLTVWGYIHHEVLMNNQDIL